MWEFYGILCFLDHGWYVLGMRDEWLFTRVSRSLSYPPFHHWWYDFPLLYWHGLIIIYSTFSLPFFVSHYLFPDIHSTFIYSLHIDTHFWFDTFFTSLTCFIDGLTTYPFSCFAINISLIWLPLGSWLVRFFLCITFCTWGYGFDHWVFEPSFLSFLSPYHLGVCYVLRLKTTLRPWD